MCILATMLLCLSPGHKNDLSWIKFPKTIKPFCYYNANSISDLESRILYKHSVPTPFQKTININECRNKFESLLNTLKCFIYIIHKNTYA